MDVNKKFPFEIILVGQRIRQFRLANKLTQSHLATMCDVDIRTIQRIENGEVDPRAYTLQMIAKALDVEFSLFVENKSDESQEFSLMYF